VDEKISQVDDKISKWKKRTQARKRGHEPSVQPEADVQQQRADSERLFLDGTQTSSPKEEPKGSPLDTRSSKTAKNRFLADRAKLQTESVEGKANVSPTSPDAPPGSAKARFLADRAKLKTESAGKPSSEPFQPQSTAQQGFLPNTLKPNAESADTSSTPRPALSAKDRFLADRAKLKAESTGRESKQPSQPGSAGLDSKSIAEKQVEQFERSRERAKKEAEHHKAKRQQVEKLELQKEAERLKAEQARQEAKQQE